MTSIDLATSPWRIRIFNRVPLNLLALGVSAALAYFVFFEMLEITLYPTMSGDHWTWGEGLSLGLVTDIVLSILFGYLIAVPYYVNQEAVRDYLDLRPALNCDDNEYDNWLARVRNTARVSLYVAAALATTVGYLNFTDQGRWMGGEQMKTFLNTFVLFRTLASMFISSFHFAAVAHRFADVELFNLERVTPFSQQALRGVLVLMLFIAILSLLATSMPFLNFDNEVFVILALPSFTAAAIFLIPLYPLHRRIRTEKQRELERISADIHRENEARIAGEEDWATLADLIVYKQEVERVSTWAFNTPTVLRFALYVSLGIGSWLGAAFVERWLGTLLGS
jgi:hypothetical protein